MKRATKQEGLSLINFLLWLIILGVSLGYGSQILFIHFKKITMSQNIEEALNEVGRKEGVTTKEIKNAIQKRFDINNIGVQKEDITVTKEGNKFKVEVNTTKEIKISDTMTLLVETSLSKTGP